MLSRKFLMIPKSDSGTRTRMIQAMKQEEDKHYIRFLIGVVIFFCIFYPLVGGAADKKPKETEEQKLLKRYANQSLSRLKYAIKKEGFYNCKVALNVWEMNAKDAGTFDQKLYDDFKKQIYEKSLSENMRWFEIFINQQNYYDARICLQLWRMHARETGVYDEALYEELKNKLK